MTAMSYAWTDSTVMFRRSLLHMRRYPVLTFMVIFLPVVFLLLFVYVFGGTLGNGLGGALAEGLGGSAGAALTDGLGGPAGGALAEGLSGLAGGPLTDGLGGPAGGALAEGPGGAAGGRAAYANYVVPGILVMAVAGAAQGTAITVAMDMTEGIIDRFRTMAIFRPSVLAGHVLGSMVQSLLGLVVITGLALAIGFRPNATFVEWLAAAAVLMSITFALVWLSVALGLVTKSVESASNLPMPLLLLPFLGSGFVPTESMPAALRWFAEYQPFTPVIETLRGLLLGTGIGHNAWLAAAWSVAITVVSFLWAKALYNKER